MLLLTHYTASIDSIIVVFVWHSKIGELFQRVEVSIYPTPNVVLMSWVMDLFGFLLWEWNAGFSMSSTTNLRLRGKKARSADIIVAWGVAKRGFGYAHPT